MAGDAVTSSQLQQAAIDMANALDTSGPEDMAGTGRAFDGIRQQIGRDDFRQFITMTDKGVPGRSSGERDGVGLDLIVSYGANGTPDYYVILTGGLNNAAKQIAETFDNRSPQESERQFLSIMDQIDQSGGNFSDQQRLKEMIVMAMATYDRKNIGADAVVVRNEGAPDKISDIYVRFGDNDVYYLRKDGRSVMREPI